MQYIIFTAGIGIEKNPNQWIFVMSGTAFEAQWDETLHYYDVEKITLQKDLTYSGSKDGI